MRGNWTCGTCQHVNFSCRTKCQRCDESFTGVWANAPKPRAFTIRPGDWFCKTGLCLAHNFANRRFCFKCGAPKNIIFFGGGVGCYNPVFPALWVIKISRRGWRPGDWFCGRLGCNAHNFGDRMLCFKCYSSRELIGYITN